MRSSRLLLVLGLLIAAALAAFAFIVISSQSENVIPKDIPTPTPIDVEVLVARRELRAGTIISDTSDLFKSFEIKAADFNQDEHVRPDQANQLVGMKLMSPLQLNQPVRRTQIGMLGLAELIPEGRRAFPIKVAALSGVGDLLVEGDFVDLLASFPLQVLYIRPGVEVDEETGEATLTLKEDTALDVSTKTLLQDIQILRILRRPPVASPPPGEEGVIEETPAAAPMQAQPTPIPGIEADREVLAAALQPGEWLLILALTDQEAEVLKYSVDKGAILNLALRPTGERETVTTTGLTFDILVRDYDVPIPRPLDLLRVQLQGAQETPVLPTPEDLLELTPTPTP